MLHRCWQDPGRSDSRLYTQEEVLGPLHIRGGRRTVEVTGQWQKSWLSMSGKGQRSLRVVA